MAEQEREQAKDEETLELEQHIAGCAQDQAGNDQELIASLLGLHGQPQGHAQHGDGLEYNAEPGDVVRERQHVQGRCDQTDCCDDHRSGGSGGRD